MDLIDRQTAIEAIEQHKIAVLGECKWDEGIAYGYAAAHRHLVEIVKQLPSAEQQEQITSEMDEIFRIASEIRLAVGCNTSRECWELARKGDIKRVKHGRWVKITNDWVDDARYVCSCCGRLLTVSNRLTELVSMSYPYCHCGAKMDEVEE